MFLIFLAGCAVQKRSCPPFATATEATAVLKEYSAGLKPLKATGNCTLNYTDEKGQKFAQSFPVRIWFETNRKFCLYGDVAFDAKAVCLVVNGDEYWTYAKPLDLYITGKTAAENEDYFSNPLVLVDFLEPVDSACDNISMLSSDNKNNILACQDRSGCKQKKIFIDRCNHFTRKIEYLDCSGNPVFVVEPGEYKNVAGGEKFLFPRKLTYKYVNRQNRGDRMQIKIDSVKLWQSNPEQLKALFSPPSLKLRRTSPPDVNSFQKSSENKETN